MEKKQCSNKIPLDIIPFIFSNLSIVGLQSCRRVCKAWNNIIIQFDSNLYFAVTSPDRRKIHCMELDRKHMGVMNSLGSFTFHPKYDSADSKILCVCHGLLLCSFFFKFHEEINYSQTEICILNPITNEYLPVFSHTYDNKYSYGFGFSLKTKQFKIVRFSSGFSTLMEIFAFGTLHPPRLGFVPTCIESKGAYYFNGALYWVGSDMEEPNNVIYRLDLEDYKLDEFSLPIQTHCAYIFGALNGGLYLTILGFKDEYHVWNMEQGDDDDDDDAFSWFILFVVPDLAGYYEHPLRISGSFHLQLIKVCEDGKFLCLHDGFVFILCDPLTRTTQILMDQDVQIKKYFEVFPIESFNFDSLHNILLGTA